MWPVSRNACERPFNQGLLFRCIYVFCFWIFVYDKLILSSVLVNWTQVAQKRERLHLPINKKTYLFVPTDFLKWKRNRTAMEIECLFNKWLLSKILSQQPPVAVDLHVFLAYASGETDEWRGKRRKSHSSYRNKLPIRSPEYIFTVYRMHNHRTIKQLKRQRCECVFVPSIVSAFLCVSTQQTSTDWTKFDTLSF